MCISCLRRKRSRDCVLGGGLKHRVINFEVELHNQIRGFLRRIVPSLTPWKDHHKIIF